jgi:NAD(P)H dehydrogenase (quinone)
MALPLLHHGMLIVGLPYSLPELNDTESGGTPYGASTWTGSGHERELTGQERKLCFAQGQRIARLALQLEHGR